ncbi:hypothetical protein [Acidocella sp.]|jgi:hypothetical protein|uniref:hypothetical protein n=1 Tax=Acidocella sp. TaxID=50710 RepID=UPI002F3FE3C8
MMIEVKRLSDVAAGYAAFQDIEAGQRQVEAIVRTLRRRLWVFDSVRAIAFILGVIVAVGGFLVIVYEAPHSSGWVANSLTVVGTCVAIVSWFSGRLLQTRSRFFVGRKYDYALPERIELLLGELALGRMRALLPAKYGSVSTSALRTVDGQLFDTEIAPSTFANRYAPLLLSSDPKAFLSLWMPVGKAFSRPIYVVRESGQQVEGEAPCDNHDPRDQWLVGGTLLDFERGREAFIAAKIPAHNAGWFQIVLTVGRRELRKGRQRGAQQRAIAVIQSELKGQLGSDRGPRGGDSEHLIKQLLQGRHGDTDITGYFAGPSA